MSVENKTLEFQPVTSMSKNQILISGSFATFATHKRTKGGKFEFQIQSADIEVCRL